MNFKQLNLVTFLLLTGVGCDESNPYKDGSVGTGQAPKTATGTTPGAGGDATTANAPIVTEAPKVADKASIPAAELTAAGVVCGDTEAITKYKVEMEVLCLNGQPTQAFADLLKTPFKGTGAPTLGLVKSVDNAGISTFVVTSGFEVPQTMAGALAKRSGLNVSNIVEGNASLVQSEVKAIPSASPKDLGGFELTATLNVSVAIITVNDVRTLTREYTTLKEGMVVRSVTFLTPGAPDNAENIVANIVSFWISENGMTKVIGVTHQQAANRNQHATAETTILNLGRRTVIDGFNALK